MSAVTFERQDEAAPYCDITYLVKVDGTPVGTVSRGRFRNRHRVRGSRLDRHTISTQWIADTLTRPRISTRLKRDTRAEAVEVLLDHVARRS